MVAAIPVEERDLVDLYGAQYEQYRRRVPALLPRPGALLAGGAAGAGAAEPVAGAE